MDAFLGEIRLFAGNFAPQGWAICNGQTLNISDYEALYSLLGTIYGGDGRTTFKIPDLRGRVVVGQGKAPDLTSNYVVGSTGGSLDVTLTTTQMPAHTHIFQATSNAANKSTPAGNICASPPGTYDFYLSSNSQGFSTLALDNTFIGASGTSGIAHSNIMPCLTINYIIATLGTYPTFK